MKTNSFFTSDSPISVRGSKDGDDFGMMIATPATPILRFGSRRRRRRRRRRGGGSRGQIAFERSLLSLDLSRRLSVSQRSRGGGGRR